MNSARQTLESSLASLAGQFQAVLPPDDAETIVGLLVAAQVLLDNSKFDFSAPVTKLSPRSRQQQPSEPRSLRNQWANDLPQVPTQFPPSPLPAQKFFKNIHDDLDSRGFNKQNVLSDQDPVEEEYDEEERQSARRPVKKKRKRYIETPTESSEDQ
jgi:hypothetical protein